MEKINPRKLIQESRRSVREFMQDSLADLVEDYVSDLINKKSNAKMSGVDNYEKELIQAIVVVADEAIKMAKKEAPKSKDVKMVDAIDRHYKFADFSDLPKSVQKLISKRSKDIVGKQIKDLETVLLGQLKKSQAEGGDPDEIEADLLSTADDFIGGASVAGGADLIATSVISQARSAYFFQPDTLEEIEAFEFNNDVPVTDICIELSNGGSGRIFAKDDPEIENYQPPLHFNAILEGTLIKTIHGEIPIEKLDIGDIVLTHNDNYKRVYNFMSKFEDKEYFEIELENGKKISITGEHPVLTKNRSWVRADQLNMSDDIVCFEDIHDD